MFLAGQATGTTNEPNFKIVCNCIHELLNVFEDSAQREHTISVASCIYAHTHLSIRGICVLIPLNLQHCNTMEFKINYLYERCTYER